MTNQTRTSSSNRTWTPVDPYGWLTGDSGQSGRLQQPVDKLAPPRRRRLVVLLPVLLVRVDLLKAAREVHVRRLAQGGPLEELPAEGDAEGQGDAEVRGAEGGVREYGEG